MGTAEKPAAEGEKAMGAETGFLWRTRTKGSPENKPRVYFTCHPDDIGWLDRICEDIFRSQDCAVYYTADMAEALDEDSRAGLERMSLFVMPVTFRLLTQPNRAMDSDYPFAAERHIPVLPILAEPGIEEFYGQRFGERQFLCPFGGDRTEISYAEKLKKYLESVLISDALAERVRKAFDAYIFLSYRKKDRKYANTLMRLIHRDPACRDIAIWFDEFLTPGESFRENIETMLDRSELFALLVTPHLLETPNFVMTEEYPRAQEKGKPVFPAEMVPTDREKLNAAYRQLPEPIDAEDEAAFRERLTEAIRQVAVTENDSDPEHNYLIGLAYLDGIDVEIDAERGVDCITMAAEAGLTEAMRKLRQMYQTGDRVPLDYKKAVYWAQKLYDANAREYGEEYPETLRALSDLAIACFRAGDVAKALELQVKESAVTGKVFGENDPETLTSLNNLALFYMDSGDYSRAIEIEEKVYKARADTLGAEDPETLLILCNLAMMENAVNNHQKALEINKTVYTARRRILGEEHEDTLTSLNNIAVTYMNLGSYKNAAALCQKVCTARKKCQGEKHPDTLLSLINLAASYVYLGEYKKAEHILTEAYELCAKVYGKEHPTVLRLLNNLAGVYKEQGEYGKAIEIGTKVYEARAGIPGERIASLKTLSILSSAYSALGDHTKELEVCQKAYSLGCELLGEGRSDRKALLLNNLASAYSYNGDPQKALELHQKAYAEYKAALGRCHPRTITSLKNVITASTALFGEDSREVLDRLSELASVYGNAGDTESKQNIEETIYTVLQKKLGGEHPETLSALGRLAYTCGERGDYPKEAELEEKLYALRCKVLGAEHEKTLVTMNNLAYSYFETGEVQKAWELYKKAYAVSEKAFGKEYKSTQTALAGLAVTCEKLGNYTEALKYFEELHRLRADILGTDHEETEKVSRKIGEIKEIIQKSAE